MTSESLKIKIYSQDGTVVGEQDLERKVFGVEVKPDVVQQIVVAQMANARHNLAKTKTRGEVAGGGRKPWKQKGTGRARQGSTRSPLWSGGGVVFGPTGNSNYGKSVNKKLKTKALFMCLTDKYQDEKIVLLDKLEIAEGKTKLMVNILNKLPGVGQKTLLVLDGKNEMLIQAARNIPKVKVIKADSLNAVDLLDAKYVLTIKDALEVIEKTYLKKAVI